MLDTSARICDVAADPEIPSVFDSAIDVLRPLVAEVRPADLPMPDLGRLIGNDLPEDMCARLIIP